MLKRIRDAMKERMQNIAKLCKFHKETQDSIFILIKDWPEINDIPPDLHYPLEWDIPNQGSICIAIGHKLPRQFLSPMEKLKTVKVGIIDKGMLEEPIGRQCIHIIDVLNMIKTDQNTVDSTEGLVKITKPLIKRVFECDIVDGQWVTPLADVKSAYVEFGVTTLVTSDDAKVKIPFINLSDDEVEEDSDVRWYILCFDKRMRAKAINTIKLIEKFNLDN